MKRKYISSAFRSVGRRKFSPRTLSKSVISKALGTIGLASIGGAYQRVASGSASKYIGRRSYVRKIAGRRRSARTKKVKYYNKKPKVNKTFRKNFNKMQEMDKGSLKYTYCSDMQLRQDTLDNYNTQYIDTNGYAFDVGGPRDMHNAMTVACGVADPNPDFNTVNANNQDAKCKFTRCDITMFFKSTSSHVVNIEIYECTWKGKDTDDSAQGLINDAVNTMSKTYWSFADNTSSPTVDFYNLDKLGTHVSDLPNIADDFNVKKHTFKLNPGDYTSKYFTARKGYVDFQQEQENNIFAFHRKGSKTFFFRVINDVTVSGDTTNSKIHAFPSNAQGGVAMRYEKRYGLLAPQGIAPPNNNVVIGNWTNTIDTGKTDQQVVYSGGGNVAGFFG